MAILFNKHTKYNLNLQVIIYYNQTKLKTMQIYSIYGVSDKNAYLAGK